MNNSRIINSLEIESLFGKKNIKWEFSDVNVLVGKNGSGKSTILNILRSLLLEKETEVFDRCRSASISLYENASIEFAGKEELKDRLDSAREINSNLANGIKEFQISLDKNQESILDNLHSELIEKLNKLKPFLDTDTSKACFSLTNIDENELLNKFNLEFISTTNMSANSLSTIKNSEGIKTTVLEMEMLRELSRFKELPPASQEKFVFSINKLFEDCEKKITYENDTLYISHNNDQSILKFSDLSSGERQLIYIFLKVTNSSDKAGILLMDEPEISLHLSWQEKFIESILAINSSCQIIIVTHSPAIVMNGWMDSYIDIDAISESI